MTTRDEWIDEGLTVLADQGLPGVRIDRIAARLGVSKGSFHHHFAGAAGYRQALLDRYENTAITALTAAAETSAAGGATGDGPVMSGQRALQTMAERLPELFVPRLETAMRAWALHDDEAAAVIRRVDEARLAALTAAWRQLVGDDDRARTAALIPHLVTIGAAASVPAVDLAELGRVFDLLVATIPAAAAVGDPSGRSTRP